MSSTPPNLVFVPYVINTPAPDQTSQSTQTFSLHTSLLLCPKLQDIKGYIDNYHHLQSGVLRWGACGELCSLDVTRIKSDLPPNKGGPAALAHIIINPDLSIKFQVAGDTIQSGTLIDGDNINWTSLSEFIALLSDMYVFCMGIAKDELLKVCPAIRYSPKCLITKYFPFERCIAKKCNIWFKMRFNATQDERNLAAQGEARCPPCNATYRGVRRRNMKQLPQLTQAARLKRSEATSKYPIKLLSPRGVKRKLHNIRTLQNTQRKKIKKNY